MTDDNALTIPTSSSTEVGFLAAQRDALRLNSLSGDQLEESTGVKANQFFPFLQVIQRTSNAVDQGANPGTFLCRKNGQDKGTNLGTSFYAVVCSIRGKATYFNKEENLVFSEYETVKNGERVKTENYEDYRAAALASAGQLDAKYRSGLDVLLWVPELKSFVTYFANTVSAIANVEQVISPYLGCPVLIASEARKNKKGSWYLPTCEETDLSQIDPMPTEAAFNKAVEQFNNPPVRSEAGGEGDSENVEGAKKISNPSKRAR
jgi:hypothetical protein